MQRLLIEQLQNWALTSHPMPTILRGARQVGKTHLVNQLAKKHFEYFININFELEPEYTDCFSTLKPTEILNKIKVLTDIPIIPGKTLIFFDEVQECPSAITSMRYFKEQMPNLHIISAGSLLEFVLQRENIEIPVGRLQFLHLYPLSFYEFLAAINQSNMIEYLQSVNIDEEIPEKFHQRLMELIRQYLVLGGMPAVIAEYLNTQDIQACQRLQSTLLNVYKADFAKYTKATHLNYLQRVFSQVPKIVGQSVQYNKIDSQARSVDIKTSLLLLEQAGILKLIYHTAASGLPLNSLINEKKFKLLFLDVGLVKRSGHIDAELLLTEDPMLINQGMITEQFVGQELLTLADPYEEAELYYWAREKPGSSAEVDYITAVGQSIVPIEVKSGTTGWLRSLQLFLNEKKHPYGIRISALPLELNKNILSVPLYMIAEIRRLVAQLPV